MLSQSLDFLVEVGDHDLALNLWDLLVELILHFHVVKVVGIQNASFDWVNSLLPVLCIVACLSLLLHVNHELRACSSRLLGTTCSIYFSRGLSKQRFRQACLVRMSLSTELGFSLYVLWAFVIMYFLPDAVLIFDIKLRIVLLVELVCLVAFVDLVSVYNFLLLVSYLR